jgi:CRISPR-associated protein Csb1
MSENQTTVDKAEVPKKPRATTDFATEFLDEKAVAIIIKQHLLPDDVENPVIFPPTYLKAKGKSQNDDKDDKSDKKESKQDQQKSVYNLDDLGDGKNVVEIDSPQSDGNKSEPLFKSDKLKHLVPQVVISVNGTQVNLLDAGHRAGDAVVRLSSLADKFHTAFIRADLGDHSLLATLAPTSILYGAWDSRSTQTKLQRIMKAGVRARNVRELTKSATFIPAAEYVKLGAIKEELDVGEGDSNPLSSEGLKYALASQSLGGVLLTDPKLLVRTIKINLVALRALQAKVDVTVKKPDEKSTEDEKNAYDEAVKKAEKQSRARTTALRNYILGLALVAATSDPDLNLREGCNLRISGEDDILLVKHRTADDPIKIDRTKATVFAEASGKEFFALMAGLSTEDASKLAEESHPFAKKDHLDATFEKDVAEEFLGLTDAKGKLSGAERDKVRALGPITRATLGKYYAAKKKRDKDGDPTDKLRAMLDKVKAVSGGKKLNADAEKLRTYITENPADTDDLKGYYAKITEILDGTELPEVKVTALKAVLPAVASPEQPVATATDAPITPEAGQ